MSFLKTFFKVVGGILGALVYLYLLFVTVPYLLTLSGLWFTGYLLLAILVALPATYIVNSTRSVNNS